MIKKYLDIVLKIIIVIVAFSLLTMLFMPKYIENNNDGRLTSEYYREKTGIDVIFVGASTITSGIAPMALYRDYGITAYSRANSSQVPAISLAMVEDAIKRNKPELVVLDVEFTYQPDDYNDEGSSRKSMDGMKWSKTKAKCIKAIMSPEEKFIDYVFPILRFHHRWNDLSLEDIKYLLYKPSVTQNGQILSYDVLEDSDVIQNPMMLDESVEITEKTLNYLQNIADICKDEGVQLMLIKTPIIAGNWNYAMENQISAFANRNDLIYINYSDYFDEIGLDVHTDYLDMQHLNYAGADRFTTYLGNDIINNYTVSDRRNDKKYSVVFDRKLAEYESKIERGND